MSKSGLIYSGILILLILAFPFACGEQITVTQHECEVTVTLSPSTFRGQAVSPEGQAVGRGVGSTQEEALTRAYKSACSKFDLYLAQRTKCESGQDFAIGPGDIESERIKLIGVQITGSGNFILNGEIVTPETHPFYSLGYTENQSCTSTTK